MPKKYNGLPGPVSQVRLEIGPGRQVIVSVFCHGLAGSHKYPLEVWLRDYTSFGGYSDCPTCRSRLSASKSTPDQLYLQLQGLVMARRQALVVINSKVLVEISVAQEQTIPVPSGSLSLAVVICPDTLDARVSLTPEKVGALLKDVKFDKLALVIQEENWVVVPL